MNNILTGQPVTNEELTQLSDLVHNQRRLEVEIAEMEDALKTRGEQLRNLSEIQIPDMLLGMGLSELKLASGEAVKVTKFYSAKIPDDKSEEAFTWLRESGNDDIIKNNIILNFGKGEDARAKQIAAELVKQGLAPEQKIFVHPMTLKSFVKERIESGQELSTELFGVYVGNKTKITPPKAKV